MTKLKYGYFIHENLDFQVQENGNIKVYKVHSNFRKLAELIKPLWRLYTRFICEIKIDDINEFVEYYKGDLKRNV